MVKSTHSDSLTRPAYQTYDPASTFQARGKTIVAVFHGGSSSDGLRNDAALVQIQFSDGSRMIVGADGGADTVIAFLPSEGQQ